MRKLILIIIVLALATSLVNAAIVSNSIIVDDIEYYMQVNDSVYSLGEDVEMLFRVTNLREEDVTISCSRAYEFDFLAEKEQETVWFRGAGWLWFSPGVEILAGEFEEVVYTWDMIGDDSNPVGIGTYNVVGIMYNEPWNNFYYGSYTPTEVTVEITIVPEPISVILLFAGIPYLRKRPK